MSLREKLARLAPRSRTVGGGRARAREAIDVEGLADDIRRDIGLPERTDLPSRWHLSGRELVGLWMRGHKL